MFKKRYDLIFLMALLALFLLAACNAPSEPVVDPAEATPQIQSTIASVSPDNNLVKIPVLTQNGAKGMGGGGLTEAAGDASARPEPAAMSDISILPYYAPFNGTVFTFGGTFPVDPTTASLWQQPGRSMTAEQARTIANQFGFTGTLYQEKLPVFDVMPVEGGDSASTRPAYQPTMPYYAFNGDQMLTIMAGNVFLSNPNLGDDYPNTAAFATIAPLAETFLKERNLLNFEYVLEDGRDGNVLVKRVVNGQPLNQPEAYLHFNNQNQLVFMSYDALTNLSEVGPYPLISAEAAWQQILNEETNDLLPFEILPNFANQPAPEPYLPDPNYKYWPRQYAAGETVVLHAYPAIYEATDGTTPLIRTYNFTLQATPELLQEIATSGSPLIKVEGVVGADGKSLQLNSWAKADTEQSVFVDGTINAGTVTDVNTGMTYVLQNIPAEVTDGLAVYVYGWPETQADGTNLLRWESIETKINYDMGMVEGSAPSEGVVVEGSTEGSEGSSDVVVGSDEPIMIDPMPGDYGYKNVTITSVTLGYYYMPMWPTGDEPMTTDYPAVYLQPVWKFVGQLGPENNNDGIVIYVQAIDPTYIQTTP